MKTQSESPPFSIVRFSGNSNSKIPATFQKRKSSSKFLLSQRNSPAHFWRTEKLILTLRQFWSTLSNPCLTGAGGLRTPRLSLKKIVENVSWNKLMLNSRFYWLVAFHFLKKLGKFFCWKRSSNAKRIMKIPRQEWDVIFWLLSSQQIAAPWRKIFGSTFTRSLWGSD